MDPTVSIIILNWNGWKDTLECLESLYQITYPNYDIIAVDNGSEDESIEKIKEYAEGKIEVESKFFEYSSDNKPIKIVEYTREEAEEGKEIEIANLPLNQRLIIIKNEKNYGFAEGNNIGIRYALEVLNPDYVLLLNNDTVVDKEFLTELVKVAESDEKIGIVGAVNYYYDMPEKIWFAGGKIDFWTGKVYAIGLNDKIKEVDYVAGSSFLIKKEVIEKVGILNPAYFIYWEETDWCARAHKAGYKVLFIPKSKIWHKVSAITKKISGFSEYLLTRNMFWFMKQHATRSQYLSFLLYFFGFRFWFTSGIYILSDKNITAVIPFLRGVLDGLKTIHR